MQKAQKIAERTKKDGAESSEFLAQNVTKFAERRRKAQNGGFSLLLMGWQFVRAGADRQQVVLIGRAGTPFDGLAVKSVCQVPFMVHCLKRALFAL